ncbi:hypothetical protein E2C01_050147 [Portunus trituberculatus]|uniref:Uncharacterized protein n=1 Tax=Portunus trituberculatus TaxID=210409 RepID=A0A5B7GI47_PORTR|nr:hypothetical protein [Portunus trituberculatus]
MTFMTLTSIGLTLTFLHTFATSHLLLLIARAKRR